MFKLTYLRNKLHPFFGLFYFVIILISSHYFWKFTILGDESDTIVTFFGKNISAPFTFMANHVTGIVFSILNFFDFKAVLEPFNIIRFDDNKAARIVWACTGIKQTYIFICIIGFYSGSFKTKLWYIPLGIFIIYLFNIFRISVVVAVMHNHFQWFDFVHEHLFKYIFYGLIFAMWVIWEEKFVVKSAKK